jgi:hypothetical protein
LQKSWLSAQYLSECHGGLRKGVIDHISARRLGRPETLKSGLPLCTGETMSESDFPDVLDKLLFIWVKALKEKRFHDALALAYANHIIAREMKDEESFLSAMKASIDGLLPADDPANRNECSFCRRSPPDVRLAAGPNVNICDQCVTMLSEDVFSRPD